MMDTVTGRVSFVRNGRFALSGAFAGAVSTLVFTIVHDIFISDIWSMITPMLVAGAMCGALVSWSYGLLVAAPSLRGWLGYNLVYVALFGMMGAVSVLLFEPVTTMAAVVTLNCPPTPLIEQAMPMTVLFTLCMAVLITVLFGRTLSQFLAVLLTCVVLVTLLGLNVSVIGLVEIPSGSLFVVAELFGPIVALNAVYAVVFVVLERRWLYRGILPAIKG